MLWYKVGYRFLDLLHLAILLAYVFKEGVLAQFSIRTSLDVRQSYILAGGLLVIVFLDCAFQIFIQQLCSRISRYCLGRHGAVSFASLEKRDVEVLQQVRRKEVNAEADI